MQNLASNRSLEISRKLYERLLAAYPRSHREKYGGMMAQLFRDQCRDAWAEGSALGVVALWCRILPDLIQTSFMERLAALNPGKFMSEKLSAFLRPGHSPFETFMLVFIVVFLAVFSLGVVITFMMPASYASTARIQVITPGEDIPSPGTSGDQIYDPFFIQTTYEVIQSQVVLSNVITKLNLNVTWGKKYYGGQPLKTAETMEMLKHRMILEPVRNTKLIAITVYSDDNNEAAQIANAVAESYQDYRANQRRQLTIGGLRALEDQLIESEAKIKAARTNLDYLLGELKIINNNPNALDQSPTLDEQMVQTYYQQFAEGQATLKQLQTQLDKLKEMGKTQLREALPTVTGDKMLSDFLAQLSLAEQQFSTLTNKYAPTNSQVTTCADLIKTLNDQINARVTGIMLGLKSEVLSKQAALDAMTAAVEAVKTNHQQEQKREQPYWEAKRNLEHLLDFHKILAAKIEEEKLDLNIPKTSLVQIVDQAVPGNSPVKPNKTLNILISALAGIFMGAVCGLIAALISMRNGKRRNAAAPGAVG